MNNVKIIADKEMNINELNLTGEEKNQLNALIEKGMKKRMFEFEKGDTYYYILSDGDVCASRYTNVMGDKEKIKFCNAFPTKEMAEKRAKEIRLYNLMANFALEVNEGWEPDWDNYEYDKHFIYFSTEYLVDTNQTSKGINRVYFKSQKLAQRCIDEIIIPFEKGEL